MGGEGMGEGLLLREGWGGGGEGWGKGAGKEGGEEKGGGGKPGPPIQNPGYAPVCYLAYIVELHLIQFSLRFAG